jgi:uncharacterized cupin superfamily protein
MTTHTEAAVTAAFRDADSVLSGLLPTEVSMAPVTSGAPFAIEDVIADTGHEFFAVWACDAGVYPRVKDKRGSFMYLLDGAGQIVDADGTTHELAGNSILILPFGWSGHWNITRTMRQVYVHTTPAPPFRAGVQPSRFASAADLDAGDQVVFDGPDGLCTVQTTAPGVHEEVSSGRARFSYVIAGEASVTGVGGTGVGGTGASGVSQELTAGSAITIPRGWSGAWHVRTALRTFDVFSSAPHGTTHE